MSAASSPNACSHSGQITAASALIFFLSGRLRAF
jgi:hypothetical protein